jgi:hypothetical protein
MQEASFENYGIAILIDKDKISRIQLHMYDRGVSIVYLK